MMSKLKLLSLLLLLANLIFADKVVPFPSLSRPFFIHADDNQLYITDGPTICIYSIKDLKLLKQFGKAGEGPREFKINPNRSAKSVVIYIHADYILVNSVGRVSYFTTDGEYIKERQTNSTGIRFQPLGKQFVGEGFIREKNTNYSIRNIYDSNFKRGKELYRRESFSQGENHSNPFYVVSPIMQVWDDKVFINGEKELEIHVFDSSGNKIYTISHEYDKSVVTEDCKRRIKNWFKTYPELKQYYETLKDRLKFPKYYPVVRDFKVADQKVYVLTFKKKSAESEFYVFDIKGKLLKKVMVTMGEKDEFLYYPYTIGNGTLYQLIENEDEEEWELHVTEIK